MNRTFSRPTRINSARLVPNSPRLAPTRTDSVLNVRFVQYGRHRWLTKGFKVEAVEEAVGGGFAEIFRLDVTGHLKVGYGSGDFEDSRICSGGKSETANQQFHHLAAFVIQLAVLFQQPVVHLGVREYPVIGETLFLQDPGFENPLSHNLAGLPFLPADQLHSVNRMEP